MKSEIFKFQLGQRVTSKKTGLPMTGTIIGVTTSDIMLEVRKNKCEAYMAWDTLYRNWKKKLVVWVKFDKPQRHISFSEWKEEFYKHFANEPEVLARWTNNDLEILYQNKTPLLKFAQYPEDDLELLEE